MIKFASRIRIFKEFEGLSKKISMTRNSDIDSINNGDIDLYEMT